jgi:hypothetical protein
VASAAVGTWSLVVGTVVLLLVFGLGIWALRNHDRQYPKGRERPGWEPDRGKLGWFATTFTWLSGGRG